MEKTVGIVAKMFKSLKKSLASAPLAFAVDGNRFF